ncbi:putative 3-dehydroshikimate dehydratase [Bisporella sp. PMI_857]|nr:putative 3-dehydroshikimate dehydratase [Bisporella sp. PMI_857]
MEISRKSLAHLPASFAIVSVGTPDDALEAKPQAISNTGFSAVELGFPNLKTFASTIHLKETAEDDYDALYSAGQEVKHLYAKHNLGILMLQPFSNSEGWKQGLKERKDAFVKTKGWVKIMQAVGTDMLQIGSSDSSGISTDLNILANDTRELADLLAEYGFSLAYENWCWATVAPTWKEPWNIVQLVDRPNIGLCLDTFQSVGAEWGDPTTSNGVIASTSIKALEHKFTASMKELSGTIPADRIHLLQISDAYRVPKPLEDKEINGLRPRGRWSYDFRPYPFNGGYLPVTQVAKAVLATGFRGWFSLIGVLKGVRDDFDSFTKGVMESYKKLLEACTDS